jgi:hypothetical protein
MRYTCLMRHRKGEMFEHVFKTTLALGFATAVFVTACTQSHTTPLQPETPAPATTLTAPPSSPPTKTPSPTSPTSRATPIPVHETGHIQGSVPASGCHIRFTPSGYHLPDSRCTPGSYDPSITPADLCPHLAREWAAERAPESETESIKFGAIARAYGIPSDAVNGELDHLISRELGGTNSEANLWDEQDGPIPNPKDTVENALHLWVCAHPTEANLRKAQVAIAANWTTALEKVGATS